MTISTSPRPVSKSTLSFWRTQLDSLDDHRTTEKLPVEADIVIIGSGYVGASTAYHMLEKSKNGATRPSIVILEAREACSGATGRNGGHLKPDPFARFDAWATEYGFDAAEEAARFEADHVGVFKELVEKEKIDCDFVVTRAVDVHLSEVTRNKLRASYDSLSKAGLSTARETFYSPEETAEAISGIKGAKGCFSYTAGHLWPYKLVLHLLRQAISDGVNLQTHTSVETVSSTPDTSGKWSLATSRGTIKAKTIVYATNAYTSALLPQYKNMIVPVRGFCCRIVPSKGKKQFLPNSYTIRHSPSEYDYLIPRTDGSIIVGGAREAYQHDLENWYNNVHDDEVLESTKKYFDGYMQRLFVGWEDSGAHTDKIWSGIMGYTADYIPHIGEVPSKPGQYICAGFTGHGMPQAFLCARGIASMIIDGKSFEESGVPRIYQTSQKRLDSKRNMILDDWKNSQPSAKL